MAIMAAVATAGMSPSLFPSPPPKPRVSDPRPSQNAPPPLPVPKPRRNPNPQNPSNNAPNRTLKQPIHTRTNYYKPLPKSPGAVVSADGDRSVVVGESGITYLLPNAPFEFQFSYSETPKAPPLAIREPAFLPFAPPSMARPWTGKAPLVSKKEKERKKKIRLFEPLGRDDEDDGDKKGLLRRVAGRKVDDLARFCTGDGRSREEILGEPLTRREVRELIKPWLSKNRQVNLGRDGLTHNMLEMIHAHWKRQEVCKVRCRGVPTVDMDNVCYHLEEKTGGKIIHRIGGIVYLFRGRNYNPRTRPRYPIMLWKPAAPVYPKLIQDAPEGLSKVDADEFRRKGRKLLPICKLAKNGIYLDLVKDVRDAFEGSPLVKVDCQGLHASDYKKIGAKLMELVPCVLLSFDEEQILMWRGNNWKPRYLAPISSLSKINKINDSGASSDGKDTDSSDGISGQCMTKQEVIRSKMFLLWKRALDSHKALLLDDNTELPPDSLLEKVEEFQSMLQASEHSYPALIMSSAEGIDNAGRSLGSSDGDNEDEFVNTGTSVEDVEDYDIDISDSLEVDPLVPYGSISVDSIAKRLSSE